MMKTTKPDNSFVKCLYWKQWFIYSFTLHKREKENSTKTENWEKMYVIWDTLLSAFKGRIRSGVIRPLQRKNRLRLSRQFQQGSVNANPKKITYDLYFWLQQVNLNFQGCSDILFWKLFDQLPPIRSCQTMPQKMQKDFNFKILWKKSQNKFTTKHIRFQNWRSSFSVNILLQ